MPSPSLAKAFIRMNRAIYIFLAIGLLTGCGERRDDVTFVILNGRPITAADIREKVLLQAKVAEIKGNPISDEQFVKWANGQASSVMSSLMGAVLIEHDMNERGQKSNQDDEKLALKEYEKFLGREGKTLSELASEFGDLKSAFLKEFNRSVQVKAYERMNWKPEITDQLVRQYFTFSTNAHQRAKRIDEEARKKADQAYGRLQAGEKWIDVARQMSEDALENPMFEKYATEWMSVSNDAMGIKELAKVLPTMKKGDYTKPIETREGLMIIRFCGMNYKLYRLARILFRMAKEVRVPKDLDAARIELAEQMILSNKGKTLDRLWKQAKIEHPMGTNFTYKIWKEKVER